MENKIKVDISISCAYHKEDRARLIELDNGNFQFYVPNKSIELTREQIIYLSEMVKINKK